jgi:hypothetical protein
MKLIRNTLSAAVISSILLLSACFPTYDGKSATNYGSRKDNTPADTSRAYQTQQQYTPVSHSYSKLSMNQQLSDQVQALNGVNSSIVMIADNVAFVALMIDNTATGTHGHAPDSGYGGESGETNNAGYVKGLYNPYTPHSDNFDSTKLNTGVNNYETVMNHEYLTHGFKQKIAETIRLNDPSVHDVYISANRDFLNQLNKYAQESWKGNSLQPFVPEFNSSVTRLFGTAPTIPENEP